MTNGAMDDKETLEYEGCVIHVFCQCLKPGLYSAACEIWEDGAVIQESRAIGRLHATAAQAKAAAFAWARQWIESNS